MRLRFFLVERPISSYFYNGRRRGTTLCGVFQPWRARNGGHIRMPALPPDKVAVRRRVQALCTHRCTYIIFTRFVQNRTEGLNAPWPRHVRDANCASTRIVTIKLGTFCETYVHSFRRSTTSESLLRH